MTEQEANNRAERIVTLFVPKASTDLKYEFGEKVHAAFVAEISRELRRTAEECGWQQETVKNQDAIIEKQKEEIKKLKRFCG